MICSFSLKTQAVYSTETTVNFYQTTWRHIRDDSHCCKSLTSFNSFNSFILPRIVAVIADGVWTGDRIYWTLRYSAWLHFTVHCFTHTRTRTLVSSVTVFTIRLVTVSNMSLPLGSRTVHVLQSQRLYWPTQPNPLTTSSNPLTD
jgi:hypothetical protein